MPRQAPVQDPAQGIDVGTNIHRRGIFDLLGSHEIQGAEQGSRFGHAGLEVPGQAEVEELSLAFGSDLDVGGLDVAVNQVVLVGLGQGTGDLVHQLASLGHSQRPAFVDHLLQVLPCSTFPWPSGASASPASMAPTILGWFS